MNTVFGAPTSDVKGKRPVPRLAGRVGHALGGPLRAARDALYPPRCLNCDARATAAGGFCASCWPKVHFIQGLACDKCGQPLPGSPDEAPVLCDDCLHIARPWSRGRAAMVYDNGSRKVVLGLKYADRHDVADAAGPWLARAAHDLLRPDTLIAPVPLHVWRLFQRRYNQSALLAHAMGKASQTPVCPDLLWRKRETTVQDGRTRAGRFENMQNAISAAPRHINRIEGRHILLVDDVMTSGATLAACAEACYAAGADDVDVVVLARVPREI